MDQERKKRLRSDQEDQDKKAKLAKRQSEQHCHNNNTTSFEFGSTSYISQENHNHKLNHDHDHDHDDHDGLGVFDFPWLKEESGVSRSDDWKLEDLFVSELSEKINDMVSATTITTPAGIEVSFTAQCLMPHKSTDFSDEKIGCDDEFFGFENVESLDCFWSAFT